MMVFRSLPSEPSKSAGKSQPDGNTDDLQFQDEQQKQREEKAGNNRENKDKAEASFKRPMSLWLFLVVFRIVNALAIQTYEMADEFWQSLEVAHHSAFGYGYLTWEWRYGIRSYLYPMLFASVFRFLGYFNLDNWQLLIKVPKIIQALIAATTDFYLFKLSRKISGPDIAAWTLGCQLVSWFTWHWCTRTFSNNLESLLTVLAFYLYPATTSKWPINQDWFYLVFVSLSFAIRPPSAIQFLPLIVVHGWRIIIDPTSKTSLSHKIGTIFRLVSVTSLALLLTIFIDSYFYGKFTVSFYNFIMFNYFGKVSEHYGTFDKYHYITTLIPYHWGSTFLIPLTIGALLCWKWPMLQFSIAFTLFIYSNMPHKEYRFILPVMTLAMLFVGEGLAMINNFVKLMMGRKFKLLLDLFWKATLITATLNQLHTAYIEGTTNKRGVIDVMWHVHDHAAKMLSETRADEPSILFLMIPCHSTPFYSHVHLNVSMYFLTCEPDLSRIFADAKPPAKDWEWFTFWQSNYAVWFDRVFSTTTTAEHGGKLLKLPSMIVLFSDMESRMRQFLRARNYEFCGRFLHTNSPIQGRPPYVVTYCLNTLH